MTRLQAGFIHLPTPSTEAAASPVVDPVGEEEEGAAGVTAVTASLLLQIEAADSEDALDSNNNSRYASSSMTILSARYAIDIIQKVHVSAGGAMKRMIKKRRRRMLSPMAWTLIGTQTVQQQITSQVNLTS